MAEEKKIITLAEMQEHNTVESLWISIHNQVYDVTEFLDEHPGGEEVLIDQAGRKATEAFEDVGHSDDARELMEQYHIGELADADKEPHFDKRKDFEDYRNTSSVMSWLIPTAISVGIIAVAVYKLMST